MKLFSITKTNYLKQKIKWPLFYFKHSSKNYFQLGIIWFNWWLWKEEKHWRLSFYFDKDFFKPLNNEKK